MLLKVEETEPVAIATQANGSPSIQLTNQCLLSTCFVPGPVLDDKNSEINERK